MNPPPGATLGFKKFGKAAVNKWAFDPKRTALLIVDVQNDYINKDGFIGRILGRRISRLRKVLRPLRHLIDFCKQYGILVIWIQSERTEATSERNKHRILPPRFYLNPEWLGGPRRGSWGAMIAEEVAPESGDVVVRKSRHSAFFGTELDQLLRGASRDTLLFAGIETNICVEASIRDAYFRDYDIVLVEDCCASGHPRGHETALRNVKSAYGLLLPSRRVMQAIKTAKIRWRKPR